MDLALFAGLLAGVSLVPKARNFSAVVAAVAVLGGLLLIEDTIGASGRGWALWVAVGASVVQATLAITALLLDAGVITPPAPRPKYDQYGHYGQYGYYGQQQPPYQQSGYGTQYGGYPSGPSTGGFGAQPGPQQNSPQSQQHGSPTPANGISQLQPAAVIRCVGVRETPRTTAVFQPHGRALLRPGSAAAGAVLAVGPVTVLTVRCRARRLADQGT